MAWISGQAGASYDRAARAGDEAKQSLPRLVKCAMDGMVRFNNKPLRATAYMGSVVSIGALGLGIFSLDCSQ